ncbi:MAG: SPFH domain-containing protein [Chloroflexi bacterium]|nr:SPFH domain-containing protein [Chloroflexota bacterium]
MKKIKSLRVRAPSRKDITLRLLEWFYDLLEGDHHWAERRAIVIVTAALIFTLMGRATEQEVTQWWIFQEYVNTLPKWAVFGLSLIHPQTLRHALPPLVGVVLAILLASNYVRDLFELPDLNTAYRYLTAAMFGWDYPTINLKASGYELDDHSKAMMGKEAKVDDHPIAKIGGPGYVSLSPGNVALFEHVGGPSKVVGAGRHFIRRFETLREVVDLRDQFRTRDEVKALTKDGIAVKVKNLQVSFRVRTSNRPRTQKEAYPFSVAAVKRIAYGKTVGPKGPSVWSEGAPNSVTDNVRGYISRTRLDDLIARGEGETKDPREKIKAMFDHKDTRKRFNDMGVDLLWVSLGHIETPQDVLDERVNAWAAEWRRQTRVTMAEGEAHKLRLMEYAKAVARLDFIESITQGLPLTVDAMPDLDVILIQFAEALNSTSRKGGGAMGEADMARLLQDPNVLWRLQQFLASGGEKPASGQVIQG